MNILPSIPSGIINLASKSSLIGKGSPLTFVNPNFDHSDRVFGIDLRLTAPQPLGLICFIVSKNDEEIGIEIGSLNNLHSNEGFINLIGKTSLQDAIDILAFTEKVVTNDSGLMHISAAVKTPLVALYGPSSPEYTPPLISKKKILRKTQGYEKVRYGSNEKGYHQSLLDIKPEEVLDALEAL